MNLTDIVETKFMPPHGMFGGSGAFISFFQENKKFIPFMRMDGRKYFIYQQNCNLFSNSEKHYKTLCNSASGAIKMCWKYFHKQRGAWYNPYKDLEK